MQANALLRILAFVCVGCGGKLLVETSDAAAEFESGAGSVGAVGGSSSAGGPSSGAGPSSGTGRATGSDASSNGVTAGSSSSSGGPGGNGGNRGGGDAGGIACMNGAACKAGQICCAISVMSTQCRAGPCPPIAPIGPVQLCATSAECFMRGDTCGPLAALPGVPIKVCNPPPSDAATSDGG